MANVPAPMAVFPAPLAPVNRSTHPAVRPAPRPALPRARPRARTQPHEPRGRAARPLGRARRSRSPPARQGSPRLVRRDRFDTGAREELNVTGIERGEGVDGHSPSLLRRVSARNRPSLGFTCPNPDLIWQPVSIVLNLDRLSSANKESVTSSSKFARNRSLYGRVIRGFACLTQSGRRRKARRVGGLVVRRCRLLLAPAGRG